MKYKFHRPNPEELKEYKKRILEDIRREMLKEKIQEDEKIPIDVKIKKEHMRSELDKWEKEDRPTSKTLKQLDKEYT